ncbi:MAG: hypothetical protein M3P48_08030 [Actinomycetota bacterium]|nr:hypothetical protein [Actinomycetota bacterium]
MNFLLLGIDSFIACIAIGALVDRGSRLRLAALFGTADLVGFLVGAGLGWQISGGMTGALTTGILVSLGVYLVVVVAATSRVAATWTIWAVPFVLTLDNLAYGLVGDHSAGALLQDGAQQALSSSLMALAGLLVAAMLSRGWPALVGRVRFAGGALIVAAGGMALLG